MVNSNFRLLSYDETKFQKQVFSSNNVLKLTYGKVKFEILFLSRGIIIIIFIRTSST